MGVINICDICGGVPKDKLGKFTLSSNSLVFKKKENEIVKDEDPLRSPVYQSLFHNYFQDPSSLSQSLDVCENCIISISKIIDVAKNVASKNLTEFKGITGSTIFAKEAS
jgi:hypothetical protein